MDRCPECGLPLRWVGSRIADHRYRARRRRAADEAAQAAWAQDRFLSPTTERVMALARATAPTGRAFYKRAPQNEEQQLLAYERAYGAEAVLRLAGEVEAAGNGGRGLIARLLNRLAHYRPERGRRPLPLDEYDTDIMA
jgi:hypothetical protein